LTIYRTYRAPADDGQALIEPGLAGAGREIAANREAASHWDVDFGGVSIGELRRTAREELIGDAAGYSRRYRDIIDPAAEPNSSARPIVMTGHQPTLFHPGVWFKNFAISAIGSVGRHPKNPIAINLVIDNDVASTSAIRIPVLDTDTGFARHGSVTFDAAAGGVPYEQNHIRDRDMFDSFDRRAAEAIEPLVVDPMVGRLWKHARASVARCENVSCAIAHARHALEGEIGLNTLELPLSIVCRTESFSRFALSILGDIDRFAGIYNDRIRKYRVHHGIRSHAHPVPELVVQNEWVEAPFWIYSDDSPQRRAAWVRRGGDGIEISDRKNNTIRLTKSPDHPGAAEELAFHGGANWKLRPRALVTTMYARLVLSDLFVHGIGGAKYDQLGDQITAAFFNVRPPSMMVVTATLRLPNELHADGCMSVDLIRQRQRQTIFSPERFADEVDLPLALLEQKRELLETIPSRGPKAAWHRELVSVNEKLSVLCSPLRETMERDLQRARLCEASAKVLRSREYSFCLFNLERLRNEFSGMLNEAESP